MGTLKQRWNLRERDQFRPINVEDAASLCLSISAWAHIHHVPDRPQTDQVGLPICDASPFVMASGRLHMGSFNRTNKHARQRDFAAHQFHGKSIALWDDFTATYPLLPGEQS